MDTKTAVQHLVGQDWRESRLGLERITELLSRLGNPHEKLKYVHVAGTNGKGSVSAMLASVLSAGGYRTGLYTSPFINEFNERIQVDGQPICFDDLAELTLRVQAEADQMDDHPTEFELITAIAFLHFWEMRCDIVVLEVGLGGRLDATNVIPAPEVAVITPIHYDHTKELGETLIEIAREKAGIIKPGTSVAVSPQRPAAAYAIRKRCREVGIPFKMVDPAKIERTAFSLEGQRFSYRGYRDMYIKLLGSYQTQNAAVVLNAVSILKRKGWTINIAAVRRGLENTTWPARFEILHKDPWFIVDGGHNLQCVDSLVGNLNTYFPGKKITFITGVMADKDFKAMFAKVIPLAHRIFTVTPDNPRALSAVELAAYFYGQGVQEVQPCESIDDCISAAMQGIEDGEVICAFGSFYMAGAIRRMFGFQ